MFDRSKHINNEKAFEDLLKESFLELDLDRPENEQMIQALSDSVMCSGNLQASKSSYSIKNLLSKISLQSVLWGLLGIVVAAIAFGFYANHDSKKERQKVEENKPDSEIKTNATQAVKAPIDAKINVVQDKIENSNDILVEEPILDTGIYVSTSTDESSRYLAEEEPVKEQLNALPPKFDQPYVFPVLTDKEIKANEKQKKKMGDQLIKLAKNQIPFIPKGSMTYKGHTETSGGFYMQNHEVTNLEYRTFLFDLLIQNKKDEFLIAKPDQSKWINSNETGLFDHYKDLYFSDKNYNEYPVVNISVEGAKLYCIWLTELIMSREDRKQQYRAKLPTETEWIYAAKGRLEGAYPWGTDSIQNRYNAFLANFNVQLLKEKFSQPFKYTTKFFGNPLKLNYTACTSAGLVLNKDTVATVNVGEYNPNWYGLYCMSGNAAEWTISSDSQLGKALGGSWGSDFEHLKITGESEYTGKESSPFVGFRFIIVPVEQ